MRDAEEDLAICEATTPGPWEKCNLDQDYVNQSGPYGVIEPAVKIGERIVRLNSFVMPGGCREEIKEWHNNARFIAESREMIGYYIKRTLELERENKKLHKLPSSVRDNEVREIEKLANKINKEAQERFIVRKLREISEGGGKTKWPTK